MNFNLGAAWIYDPADRRQVVGGVSLYNITKPKQSFYDDLNVELDRRFNVHLQGTWPLGSFADILPAIQWGVQGTYREMLVGARYRYWLHDQLGTYSAAYIGAFARTRDAGYVMVGMDYNAYTVQLSYDVNTSDLNPASNNRGGFEIALMVRVCAIGGGPARQQYIVCPDYL